MLDKSKNYLIVGLGLLGGRYAQVLSQKGYSVTGITHSQSTLDYALQHDYIRAGKNKDFEDLVRQADCIIFGLYPTVLLDWVEQYGRLRPPCRRGSSSSPATRWPAVRRAASPTAPR